MKSLRIRVREDIIGSAEARKQLYALDACLTEVLYTRSSVEELNRRGDYLRSELFEFSAEVTQKEKKNQQSLR